MWGMGTAALSLFIALLVALPIGLIVLASPLFAILIFILVGGVLLVGAALRRSAESVEDAHGSGASESRGVQSPRSGGAPVSGEGGTPTG